MRCKLIDLVVPCRIEGLIASQVGNYVNPLVEGTGTITTPRQYIKSVYGCVYLPDLPTTWTTIEHVSKPHVSFNLATHAARLNADFQLGLTHRQHQSVWHSTRPRTIKFAIFLKQLILICCLAGIGLRSWDNAWQFWPLGW